ncbi:MAG: hypothetical protein ACRCZI_04350, partial [Cetobacterium sp.]
MVNKNQAFSFKFYFFNNNSRNSLAVILLVLTDFSILVFIETLGEYRELVKEFMWVIATAIASAASS